MLAVAIKTLTDFSDTLDVSIATPDARDAIRKFKELAADVALHYLESERKHGEVIERLTAEHADAMAKLTNEYAQAKIGDHATITELSQAIAALRQEIADSEFRHNDEMDDIETNHPALVNDLAAQNSNQHTSIPAFLPLPGHENREAIRKATSPDVTRNR